jgi:hypothetical protein
MNRHDVISTIAALGFAVTLTSAHAQMPPNIPDATGKSISSVSDTYTSQTQSNRIAHELIEKLALRAIGVDIT